MGKKIKGKKRHILVDKQGLLLHAIVHAADIQDRDGGVLLMSTLFGLFPFLLKLYADSGYQGAKFQQSLQQVCEQINVEIVKRSDAGTFVVLPKRWIVERTIAWLNRCRRLAKDWDCLNRNGLAFLRRASIRLMLRKLYQESLLQNRKSFCVYTTYSAIPLNFPPNVDFRACKSEFCKRLSVANDHGQTLRPQAAVHHPYAPVAATELGVRGS